MLKNKIIPLLSAMFLLAGCNKIPVIELKSTQESEGKALISDEFKAKKGQKYIFHFTLKDLNLEPKKMHTLFFLNVQSGTPSKFIDVNDVDVSYNGTKFTKYDGNFKEWGDKIESGDSSVNDTYFCTDVATEEFSKACLFYYHPNAKNEDDVRVTIKSDVDDDSVNALFYPSNFK